MPTHINSQTAIQATAQTTTEGKTVLFLGTGYVATHFAPALIAQGYHIMGTTRSQTQGESLKAQGIDPLLTDDLQGPALRDIFERAEIILSSIPPKKSSDENGHFDPVLSALKHSKPTARWVGYLSATSVYGDRDGQWAFEGESPTPQLKRGIARAEAEIEWIETLWPIHIFRLAGIYGPGRAPFEKLRNGEARAVIKGGHIVNRIHVEDIVTAVMASIETPNPQRIYNLADGHPAPPQDVLDFAAKLISVKKPPRVGLNDESVSKMARSFYSETKRVDNSRAKRELRWTPKYESYETGLKAILSGTKK